MNQILKVNRERISILCKKHKVKTLYVFGSVLTTAFDEESDVDFIVDFLPQDVFEYADNYYQLKFGLERILDRSIDLLEEKTIKNPYFREVVEKNKQVIYGH